MLLGGRYELLRAIASGGMATVHLARAVGVGGFERLVAIKVMHQHIASEPEFVAMFLDEARLAARIRHPNVVATIDVQEAEDGLLLVMEFVDGPSLKHLRKRPDTDEWRLPINIVLRVMIDALNGLHAAHELCGDDGEPLLLVHRDVSPANILIGTDGVARITDFGVARAETRLSSTRGGQLKGKVPYMPPEQLLGEPVDRRCDVYAAGVVLWEELVGRRLFRADSEGALLQQILTGPAQSPRELQPSVPEAIDHVCMRALTRHPAERYASAAEMADALEAAAAHSGLFIASSRAVAAFIDNSGAHEKLDAKKLAAIKRASGAGVDMPPSRQALSSQGSWPTGGSGSGQLPPPSVPSAASNVTAGATAISTHGAHVVQRSSNRNAIVVGGSIALVGIVAGLVLSRPSVDPNAVPVAGAAEAAPLPATTASATATASASTTAAPSSAPAASTATPKTAAPSPVVAPTPPPTRPLLPPTRPQVVPTKPQPPSGSYNPDKL